MSFIEKPNILTENILIYSINTSTLLLSLLKALHFLIFSFFRLGQHVFQYFYLPKVSLRIQKIGLGSYIFVFPKIVRVEIVKKGQDLKFQPNLRNCWWLSEQEKSHYFPYFQQLPI